MAKPKPVKQPVYKALPYSTTPPGSVTPDEAGGTQTQKFKAGPLEQLAYVLSKRVKQAPD